MSDQRLDSLIARVAPAKHSITVLNGNQIERFDVAKRIHNLSNRSMKPIIALNCAAIERETLLTSELFGHEKGSFTGAYTRKIGLMEVANGGTLFLDNVHELSPGNQARLHGFFKNQDIFRIGGREAIPVDVRVIVGTFDDIEELIGKGRFREDLFYQMNTITIRLDREEFAEGTMYDVMFDPNITIHELEKRYVLKALKHFNGNKTQAANALGITIKTLYNKLHEYGEFENHCIKVVE